MTGDWSAVIVNYNGEPFLSACLAALDRVRMRPRDIFVVDNASTDDSMLELHAYPRAQALPQRVNLGFAGGANAGLERVETSCAVVMNPDVELDPGFGQALVGAFSANERLGAAGALLLYPDGATVQHAGGVLTRPQMFTDHRGRGMPLDATYEREIDIEFATGGAIGLRMSAVREIGGFDTEFAPVYYEDVDLCARLRAAGWEVRYIPALRALHHEGVTLGDDPDYFVYLHRNRIRYALRHLSEREWTGEFLPAEFARIRHELERLDHSQAAQRVGAEAVEMLLRDIPALAPADDALGVSPRLPDVEPRLDELEQLRRVEGKPLQSKVPLLGSVRNLVNNLGPRWYVDAALAEQRAFNDAVVRAFEAQRLRNDQQRQFDRERTAATLLLALVLLGRLHRLSSSGGDQEESRRTARLSTGIETSPPR